jgi:ABC-type polysaccharide transport system permease subunit
MILRLNSDHFLNSIDQLIVVMAMVCVFLEVQNGCLNIIIKASFGFKGLIFLHCQQSICMTFYVTSGLTLDG